MERPAVNSREDLEAVIVEVPAGNNLSLRKLLEHLGQTSRIAYSVTARLESDEAMDGDLPLNPRTNVGLCRLLDEIAQSRRLSWSIKSGGIQLDLARPVDYGKAVMKIYDLRSFLVKPPNAPRKPTALCEMMPGGSVVVGGEEPNTPILSSDDIVTLITENVDSPVWEQSDQYHINMTPNCELIISAPEETHKRIVGYMKWAHRFTNRQWEAKIWMFAVSPARAARLADELSAVQWDTLRRQGQEGKDCSLIGYTRLMGFPQQRVGANSGTLHNVIREYTPEGQPVTDEILEGVKLLVTGSPDEARTLAEMQVSVSHVVSMEKLSTKRGEICMPEMLHTELKMTRNFTHGCASVMARLPGYAGGKPGQDTLVLIAVFNAFTPE
jgi:hypothetical protein